MTYPPSLPASNRFTSYPTSVPASDHDQLTAAVQDILTELGSTSLKGTFADLISRIVYAEGASNAANRRATGWETFPRQSGANTLGIASGTAKFTYLTPGKSFTCTQIEISTGAAAAATVTTCKVALHSVDASGNLTRLAVSSNDATLFTATNTTYTKAISPSVPITAGQRYAIEVFVVATTTPQFTGISIFNAAAVGVALSTVAPAVCSNGPGSQTDSLTSYAVGTLTTTGNWLYGAILP